MATRNDRGPLHPDHLPDHVMLTEGGPAASFRDKQQALSGELYDAATETRQEWTDDDLNARLAADVFCMADALSAGLTFDTSSLVLPGMDHFAEALIAMSSGDSDAYWAGLRAFVDGSRVFRREASARAGHDPHDSTDDLVLDHLALTEWLEVLTAAIALAAEMTDLALAESASAN